jgi:hypothetical protein
MLIEQQSQPSALLASWEFAQAINGIAIAVDGSSAHEHACAYKLVAPIAFSPKVRRCHRCPERAFRIAKFGNS